MTARDWERFLMKVQEIDRGYATPCWEWTACVNDKEYGQFSLGGKRVLAHRVSKEHVDGPIPAGLVVDHKCRNHRCTNPAHLENVTGPENTRRGFIARGYALPAHSAATM